MTRHPTPSQRPWNRLFAALVCTAAGASACSHPVVTAVAPVTPVAADSERTETPTVTHRYYANRPYGTESEFNPLSLILNGGYDQLRVGQYRYAFKQPYASSFENVIKSVVIHPDITLRQYGYGRWLRNEMFPLTLKSEGGGQWYPNYQLHLFAGGMTYVRTVEWYEQHGVTSHPELAAGATVYAWHLLTETIENGDFKGYNEDPLSDLLFFDSGSILLWNQEWMKRWFSGNVEFTDWPGQVALSLPNKTVENAYMMAMLRVPIPRSTNWKAMTTMGAAFLVGVSRRVSSGDWLSVAAGFDPADNPTIDSLTNTKTVTVKPNAGLFYDRNGSLLASIIVKGGSNDGPTLNIYPGVIAFGHIPVGLWAQEVKGGGFRYGISSQWGVGVSTFHR